MKRSSAPSLQNAKRVKTSNETRNSRVPSRNNKLFKGYTSTGTSELKYIDIPAATYAGNTTGSITLLNPVAQGLDNTDRIGRQYKIHSVHVRGIVYPEDVTTLSTLARLIVVWDSDTNGTTPSMTDLLTASNSISELNVNNSKRFKILANIEFPIGATNLTANAGLAMSPTVHAIDRYIKLPGVITENMGTGALASSIQQGAVWMFTIGNTAAGDGAVFELCSRVRFSDA